MKLTLRILACTLAALASASAQILIYDNTLNFSGQVFLNGGAANQSGNTITRLVADDITPLSGYAGMPIQTISFSVANLNSVAVSARPRLRIYGSDGPGGAPGTVIAGFSFNPITFTANTSAGFTFSPGINVPNGTFWMGLTFDDNTGTTGATAAQLNNLGMALFNPVGIGTSADIAFQTTAAGSFLANNPAGSTFNLGGNPVANFFFGITVVPEPSEFTLAGLGIAATMILRRRK
jgi:hypothetical protein